MKPLPKILLALTAVAALSVAYPARANFIATINQVGTNVDVTGSGTIDLTALSFITPAAAGAAILPSGAYLVLATGNVAVYTGFSGPTSFGSGGVTFASSTGGNAVGIAGHDGELFVPQGYVSGAALSGTSTYAGATLLSLGVTPGTYTWTWGTGVHADSFTINAGVGVPDAGSTLPLLGCALLGLAALRRKLSC